MPHFLVSIITPAYKAEAFIGDAVRSALAQTYDDWEMLIVSDDGQDYQAILARQGIDDARLKCLTTGGIGTGPSRGRNIGLKEAKGDVIALLDADDTWSANYLEVTAPHAIEHGMVITKIVESVPNPLLQRAAKKNADAARKYSADEMDFFTHGINALYRRSSIDRQFHEGIRFGEDFIFNLQLLGNTGAYYYEPAAHYYYTSREGSLCKGLISDEEYLQCKTRIAEELKNGSIVIKNPMLHTILTQYMDYAVAVEKAYHQSKAQRESADFIEFHKKNPVIVPMFPEYFERIKKHGHV